MKTFCYVLAVTLILGFAGLAYAASVRWAIPEVSTDAYYDMMLHDRAAGYIENLDGGDYRIFAVRQGDYGWVPRKVLKSATSQEIATQRAREQIEALFAKREPSEFELNALVILFGQHGKQPPALDEIQSKLLPWWRSERDDFFWSEPDIKKRWVSFCRLYHTPAESEARSRIALRLEELNKRTALEIAFFTFWVVCVLVGLPALYRWLKSTVSTPTNHFLKIYLAIAITTAAALVVVPRYFYPVGPYGQHRYGEDAATGAAGPGAEFEIRKWCEPEARIYPGDTILYRPLLEVLAKPMLFVTGPILRSRFTLYFILFYSAVGDLTAMLAFYVIRLRRTARLRSVDETSHG